MTKAKKVPKHPDLYTIFKPNHLIRAKKDELNLTEIRVYNEILNHNHKKYPEILIYKIPYDNIIDVNDSNLKRNKIRISGNLMGRKFYFEKDWMFKHFGEKIDYAFVPFPTIGFDDEHTCFEVHLNPIFKKILTFVGEYLGEHYPFTKGDIESLRGFNHEITHNFYWLIRNKQAFKKTWVISVTDLKEDLNLGDKYKEWRDFKKRVLDIVHMEMKDTWTEFSYTLKKGGVGGAVKDIIFSFKHGPHEEDDKKPVGFGYGWEKQLLNLGLNTNTVKLLRQRVNVNTTTQTENGKEIIWDSVYIDACYEAASKQYAAMEKDKTRKKVNDKAAWFYEGMEKGWWLDQVDLQKRQMADAVQSILKFNP